MDSRWKVAGAQCSDLYAQQGRNRQEAPEMDNLRAINFLEPTRQWRLAGTMNTCARQGPQGSPKNGQPQSGPRNL